MKKSELRQIIREEISAYKKTYLKEGFIDKFIDSIFGSIKSNQERQALKAIEKDPEYNKAKQELEDAFNNAVSIIDRLSKKYPEINFNKTYYK